MFTVLYGGFESKVQSGGGRRKRMEILWISFQWITKTGSIYKTWKCKLNFASISVDNLSAKNNPVILKHRIFKLDYKNKEVDATIDSSIIASELVNTEQEMKW